MVIRADMLGEIGDFEIILCPRDNLIPYRVDLDPPECFNPEHSLGGGFVAAKLGTVPSNRVWLGWGGDAVFFVFYLAGHIIFGLIWRLHWSSIGETSYLA